MRKPRKDSTFFPRCILGTAGLGGVWGKVKPEESVQAVLLALEHGVTAIDTAPAYGDAEVFVGHALGRWGGPMPRLSTKVGRLKSYAANEGYYDYSSKGLEKSIRNSLMTLRVSAVDVLFLHEPASVPQGEIERVIEDLISFRSKGYARKIGVGGNSPLWFKRYISEGIFDVVMEYNRLNACCLDAVVDTLPECASKNIEFYAASPLYMGLLGDRMMSFVKDPPAWLDIAHVDLARQINEIANMYRMPIASLAHRFLLTLPDSFKIVIGAADVHQLLNTMADFRKGPLGSDMYRKIMECLTNKVSDDVSD